MMSWIWYCTFSASALLLGLAATAAGASSWPPATGLWALFSVIVVAAGLAGSVDA